MKKPWGFKVLEFKVKFRASGECLRYVRYLILWNVDMLWEGGRVKKQS